jgi:tRNA 2-thiouridine synthesizing protein E
MERTLNVDGREIALDKEGHLVCLEDWSPRVAGMLARREGLELSDAHWEIIGIVREFHARRGLSPIMRILVKLVEVKCGPDKGNSLYLLRLFPDSPAKLAAKIAGLPRPTNCL